VVTGVHSYEDRDMTRQEEANVAIVKAAYAAGARGDWDAFFADVIDETEFHEAPSLPYGGVYRGRADIVRGAKLMFGAWDDFQYKILQYTAGGDIVVVHVLISGIGRKTGKSFSMPIMEMWRCNEGKVIEIRPFYFDTSRCVECFG
jgi:ketosteroid isomerase-like protein